ncbi:MAG TPA: MFS transporter [Verrucomicrobiae bacterium]|nr:MFS transporter [Verrucomicrobiae bacterium]
MPSPKAARPDFVGSGALDPIFRKLGSDPLYERWRWQTFAITWLAYAGFNLTRMSFAVSKAGIEADTHIQLTERQMAGIDGAFLAAYAIGQFFWGVAGDRFGPRRVVLTGMLCSVLAGFVMGACSNVTMFVALFFFQGLCQSSGWAPLVKNVGNFFSRRERGFVLGLWCTNYAVGGLMASLIASVVAERLGWRYAFYVPAGILLGVWILFYCLQRDRPEDLGLPPVETYHGEPTPLVKAGETPEEEPEGSWKVIRAVLSNPMVILLGAVYFCLKPTRYAILFWGPKYIYDRLGSDMAEAGILSSMFELAGPFSILLMGVVSDRVFGARRMPVSILCLFLLGGLLFALDHLPATRWALGASLFLLGFLAYAPDAMIAGVAVVDFGAKKGASTATGLVNGLGSIGAMAGGVIPGLLQESWGWQGVFNCLGAAVVFAGLLLLPKWNAVPPAISAAIHR